MKPELARAAIEFLKRTDLKGVEAFVLVDVLRELDHDANAKPDEDRSMRVVGGAA